LSAPRLRVAYFESASGKETAPAGGELRPLASGDCAEGRRHGYMNSGTIQLFLDYPPNLPHAALLMEYRGKHYAIVQGIGPLSWKWSVHLDEKGRQS
jgi:hypothetical protein